MVTKEEWDELEKKLDAWARHRSKGLNLEKVTCADCRQLIEPSQLRTQVGDKSYHADSCGPH